MKIRQCLISFITWLLEKALLPDEKEMRNHEAIKDKIAHAKLQQSMEFKCRL